MPKFIKPTEPFGSQLFESCTINRSDISPNGGRCGIRTHGSLSTITGFQDRLHKPLGQPAIFPGFAGRPVVARMKRFELPTCRLGGGCSIQLSYMRISRILLANKLCVFLGKSIDEPIFVSYLGELERNASSLIHVNSIETRNWVVMHVHNVMDFP